MTRELYSGISEPGKASTHRFDDARALMNAVRWRGAMDMAGYAVECLLQTKLIGYRLSMTRPTRRIPKMPKTASRRSKEFRAGATTTFDGAFTVADENLKCRIKEVLKHAYFDDLEDLVDVSDGLDDNLHVVIVSHKFDGRRMKEKHDLIWGVLLDRLTPEEWEKISLSIGMSPEEIKAM